jgi:hypothetical protein
MFHPRRCEIGQEIQQEITEYAVRLEGPELTTAQVIRLDTALDAALMKLDKHDEFCKECAHGRR